MLNIVYECITHLTCNRFKTRTKLLLTAFCYPISCSAFSKEHATYRRTMIHPSIPLSLSLSLSLTHTHTHTHTVSRIPFHPSRLTHLHLGASLEQSVGFGILLLSSHFVEWFRTTFDNFGYMVMIRTTTTTNYIQIGKDFHKLLIFLTEFDRISFI